VGQGLSAVLPVVVVGIVADLLVQLLLHVEVVGCVVRGVVVGCELLGRIRHGTTKHLRAIVKHPGGGVVDGERGWNGMDANSRRVYVFNRINA
jgi:hypothetical protein